METTPLILVFYLDRDLMSNPEIMKPFADSINRIIEHKKANIIALFMPTDGEEKVECINPVMLEKPDIEKINSLIDDIKKNFSIGEDTFIVNEEKNND